MILNERKIKILEAIVNDYIQTAEPIGSRTIAKKYDFGISSATIRNEMSDLEDLGLIIQPHASSGRVPSDKGYRLYVDSIMNYRELNDKEKKFLEQMVLNNINEIDEYMQETAKLLSALTNYTTIVSEPKVIKAKIKLIQLLPFDNISIIMVLITDTKVVKNHEVFIGEELDYYYLSNLSILLNTNLYNLEIDEISVDMVDKIKNINEMERKVIKTIIKAIKVCFYNDNDVRFYTSGVKNILSFPEFNDFDKASEIFQTFEEKNMLVTLFNEALSDNIQIIIGSENSLEHMKNCSIIRANYKLDKNVLGNIAIIGPTRMDYAQAASVLSGILKNINLVLKALSDVK